MPSTASLVRKLSLPLLRSYFASIDLDLPDVDWDGPTTAPVLRAVEALPRDAHQRVVADLGRVSALADDAGQNALAAASNGSWKPDDNSNPGARAFAVFLGERDLFRRAEEIRYSDDHRRGKHWEGFLGDKAVAIKRDAPSVEAFCEAVRAHFRTENVHVDLFDRYRKRHGKTDVDLVQATVYVEGAADQMLAFNDGQLDLRDYRPVVEASLTYEPATGTIEVVGKDQQTRQHFVKVFATSLLGIEVKGDRLPFRQFDLEGLRRDHEFPTDVEDAVEEVRVLSLRLMPLDDAGERVTLERMRGGKGSIWEMARSRFGEANPLSGGWRVTQARLAIKFRPGPGAGRGKTLPVTITMPHGCDLKDRTERERIVGEKYLHRWGLLRELDIRA